MQKAAASLSAYLPAALRGSSSAASGSGSGSRSGIGLGLGLGLGLSSDDESKRYIQLPTLAPGDGPHIGGRTSSDSFTSQLSPRILHPAGKRRFRLALIVGGVVAVVMLVGAARHTGALESGARALRGSGSGGNVYVTTEWEGAEEDRPARWGWTEEMGWMEDESSMWLGDGEGAYRLGFGKGMDGTEWYIKHLHSFAESLPTPLSEPLLANLRSHFAGFFSEDHSLSPSIRSAISSIASPSPASAGTRAAKDDASSPHTEIDSAPTADSTADESQSYSLPGPMISYKNIFQTDREPAPDAKKKWEAKNRADGWQVDFYDDERAQSWMEEHFAGSRVEWAWDAMKRGVLRADFLRYMLPLVKGGVYVDVDTAPVRPIEEWGTHNVEYLDISFTDGQSWRSSLSSRPSVVVGVDVDVHAKLDWTLSGWPRPLGICQWALSSAPHHPIMLDAVRRVVNATHVVADWEADRDRKVERLRKEGKEDEAREWEAKGDVEAMSVMEWTGPGLFTDAVTGFLLARYGVTWHRLRNLDHPLRIGDVLILPITAFSPGGEADFKSGRPEDRQSALVHGFRGSWKEDGW